MSVSPQQKNQLVFVSSKYATKNNTTKNSDVVFRLSRAIHKPKDTNLCVKVQQFIFPVGFNINSTNNTLVYSYDSVDQPDIVIPEGDYNVLTLEAYLVGALTLLDVSFDETTLSFTFEDPTNEFSFDETSTCLYVLGLSENIDHDSAVVGGVNTITSEFPIDLSYNNVLYVSIPNLSINNLNGNTGQRSPVIASIPIDVYAGGIVVYTNDAGLSSYTQEDVINEFNIRIYNEDIATLVDFTGKDWFMTLQIDFIPV